MDYLITWKSMERIYRERKVKAIGVSNFNKEQMERLLNNCEIKPMVNQIEVHLYFQNKELVKYCQDNQVQVLAFAPLATPRHCLPDYKLAENEIVQKIAKKYKRTWAQICLRFLTQQNILPVVAADNEKQMNENINCNTFDLEESDMIELKQLDKKKRIYIFDYAKGYRTLFE